MRNEEGKGLYASVSSRNRRTVLRSINRKKTQCCESSWTYLRTVAAAVVETVHAPPAITFLHDPQFQMPTAVLFTESYRND